jgi:hypothetical protein
MRCATKGLACAPRVEELQADATVKIQSAEYAYNRLVLDCTNVCHVAAATTLAPAPDLPRQAQVPAEEPEPLAA